MTKLTRGRGYAIRFVLETTVSTGAIGAQVASIFSSSDILPDGFAILDELNLTVDVDVAEQLEKIQMKLDAINERAIEENLERCSRVLNLRMPEAVGGELDDVHDVVEARIASAREAGADPATVARAELVFAKADGQRSAGTYHDAYRSYCRAYRKARVAR